jgi:peroxiredoxin
MAAIPPSPNLGMQAPDFTLPATDGNTYSLADITGENGTLIAFICNHCPYVKAVVERFVVDMEVLKEAGIGVATICANDAVAYPGDSFDNMRDFAIANRFTFPYLQDVSQDIARAYGAACTPDYFGFNGAGELRFRGRLDEGRVEAPPAGAKRELVDAMRQIAATGQGPQEQIPSMGCSIKWRE